MALQRTRRPQPPSRDLPLRPEWQARHPETQIGFDPAQYDLYLTGNCACIYRRWPISVGRSRHGEFAVVVTRDYYRARGYTVWAAEPRLPGGEGFILVSFPGKRRKLDPAFEKMKEFFPGDTLERLNATANLQKRKYTGNEAGGDPDLFVFRGSDRFFVEAKWNDKITAKQNVTFPLIVRFCGVDIKVARIRPLPSSRITTGGIDAS